jgi:hypothetical protein
VSDRNNLRHPMQPIVVDDRGRAWFKANRIVRWMLDEATAGRTFDLNVIARESTRQGFTAEDHMQLAQLIGYSISGFGELSYVDDATYDRASEEVERVKAINSIGAGI